MVLTGDSNVTKFDTIELEPDKEIMLPGLACQLRRTPAPFASGTQCAILAPRRERSCKSEAIASGSRRRNLLTSQCRHQRARPRWVAHGGAHAQTVYRRATKAGLDAKPSLEGEATGPEMPSVLPALRPDDGGAVGRRELGADIEQGEGPVRLNLGAIAEDPGRQAAQHHPDLDR